MKKFMKETKEFVKQNKWWFIGCVAAGVALAVITEKKVPSNGEIHAICNQANGTVDILAGFEKNHSILYVMDPGEAQNLAKEITDAVTDINNSMLL